MPKRLKFTAPVDQVAANDIHNHNHYAPNEPPDDPEVSLECPQCKRLTWRYSEHCIHCGLATGPLSTRRWWLRLVLWWRSRRRPPPKLSTTDWGML
jgi:hypothetical protein